VSETPFIKFFPGDFLGGTSGLSPAERGAYITLLCLMYEQDGPIERDDARLARRCGAPKATFQRLLQALIDAGKIVQADGFLSNQRAEKAIVDRQIRTQNSTHAANSRWNEQKGKTKQKQRPQDAGAMPEQCVSDAKPESRSQSIGEEGLDKSNPPPPIQRVGVEFLEELAWACGYSTASDPPDRWLDEGTADLVGRWLDLGLSREQVIEAAKKSRQHHKEPPHSPKALQGAMEVAAGSRKGSLPKPVDVDALVQFWEAKLIQGGFIAPSSISPPIARAILARGTVTEARMRELGIAC
jgi:uncharacterized protein YdaU (DUF1376 family)